MDMDKISVAIENAINDIGVIFSMEQDMIGFEDLDLTEYIEDSVKFLQFIVALEDQLDIEIPDELLNIEILRSFNGFSSLLKEFINQ